MESELDEGQTVHVRVVDVRKQAKLWGKSVVIEFEILDEGPHLGRRLIGQPERQLWDWMATLLDYRRSFVGPQVQLERILNHTCRAVIGIARTDEHRVVRDVLPS